MCMSNISQCFCGIVSNCLKYLQTFNEFMGFNPECFPCMIEQNKIDRVLEKAYRTNDTCILADYLKPDCKVRQEPKKTQHRRNLPENQKCHHIQMVSKNCFRDICTGRFVKDPRKCDGGVPPPLGH